MLRIAAQAHNEEPQVAGRNWQIWSTAGGELSGGLIAACRSWMK